MFFWFADLHLFLLISPAAFQAWQTPASALHAHTGTLHGGGPVVNGMGHRVPKGPGGGGEYAPVAPVFWQCI